MGYELRLERDQPLTVDEVSRVLETEGDLSFLESRDVVVDGNVVARWSGDPGSGKLAGQPSSDWHVAWLARLADVFGARLTGEDGEVYTIRDGIVEQRSNGKVHEFGKLEEILAAGLVEWNE
ncbi:hypothetical protein [Bailinhaonella thermotolerans]|uniref:Uncharacterized protein n=1 Tax=Bailinhaonella thermotolerans TaxID=1070861 RepID=A0A3A4AYN6_9ACTN|nr:hypothetical protein [Bailinhaonella thermotolerans]RJL33499.1 hypothetical protein D5H75_12035 [Bailinhaonella thermotolerans]